MRSRSLTGHGLLVAGAFVLASSVASVAFGAPSKHKKFGKKAPPAASSASASAGGVDEKSDSIARAESATSPASASASASASEASPKPSEALDPKPEAAPPPVPTRGAGIGETDGPARASRSEAAPSDRDLEALGRREAARIAAGRTEVAVWFAAGVARRTFKYSDPVGQQYAPYHLPLAPVVSMGLEAYPFASSGALGLQDLGFRAHFSKAFAVTSNTPEGVAIDTSWTRFGAEARQRLLFAGPYPVELGFAVGVDGSYFDMSTKSAVAALLPSARTISVRIGLDARLQLIPRLGLALGVAYLAPTTRGAIYERFRGPHLRGVDGDLAAVLGIVPGLDARATARYTRYFASFKPEPGDGLVAGGALDEQFQLGLGVRYAH